EDGDRRRSRAAPGRPEVLRAVQRVAHAPRGPQLMTLRLVGRAESAHVCALIEAITQELYSLPYPEQDWSGGWVALDGNAITGMVKTFDDRVEDLWVLRDRRSQGIGARLLAHAEREIAQRGHRVARLRTVAANQRTRA